MRTLIIRASLAIGLVIVVFGLYLFQYVYPSYRQVLIAEFETDATRTARLIDHFYLDDEGRMIPMDGAERSRIEQIIRDIGVIKIKLFAPSGETLYSSDAKDIGTINSNSYFHQQVANGEVYSKVVEKNIPTLEGQLLDQDVIETYVPIIRDGEFAGAFEVYYNITDSLDELGQHDRSINITLGILLGITLVIFSFFASQSYRKAWRHERRQTRQLKVEVKRRRKIEKRLKVSKRHYNYLAHHDALTGLPNRALFMDRLEHAAASAHRQGHKLAVLYMDLDRLKHVNDTLGHEMGDELLKLAANTMSDVLRESDTLARMGGDEFTVILEDARDINDITMLATRLIEAFQEPFQVGRYQLKTGTSIGIGIYPDDGEDINTLLKNADRAMYEAKQQGRGTYRFYTDELNAKAAATLILENSLIHAIKDDQLQLYYQPQIDLKTGAVKGGEALIRWVHPELGMVFPTDFIPLAEESGLIVEIGEWVLKTACAQAKLWQEKYGHHIKIAVNLSARQFVDLDLADKVKRVLNQEGVDPALIDLELTESVVMKNADQATTTLQLLADLGVGIAIDDFGTGYSSLSYLRRFPISKLKIDRSFISELDDPEDAAIVEAIINMAHSLGLAVIAEGIEKESQLAYLQQLTCDQGQGFLYAKPIPAGEFETLFLKGEALVEEGADALVVD